jgi:hypothetical protein
MSLSEDAMIIVGGHRPMNVMAAHCQLCAGCNRTVWISPSHVEHAAPKTVSDGMQEE